MNEFFEIIVREKYKTVYGFLFSMLRNQQLAEELTQDTFMLLLKKIEFIDRKSPILPWLLTTARNLAWNAQKRQNFENKIFLKGEASFEFWEAMDEQGLGIDQHLKALEHCIDELSEQQSEAVKMFYSDKLTCTEIASTLNVTVEAIYNRLSRIRKSLRRCIEKKVIDL